MTSLYPAPPGPEVQGGEESERSEVRFREQTGKHLLVLRLTGFDPEPTSLHHSIAHRWNYQPIRGPWSAVLGLR
jgi:hypothetical protein